MGAATNLVITSDHGMAALDPARTVFWKTWSSRNWSGVAWWRSSPCRKSPPSTCAGPAAGSAVTPARRRRGHRLPPRDHTPPHWRYGSHPRIGDIVCLLADGWRIRSHTLFAERPWAGSDNRGSHGYDPCLPSMRALFIGNGPAFVPGRVVEPFQNIHVYPLLARLLEIEPAAGDGAAWVTADMHPAGSRWAAAAGTDSTAQPSARLEASACGAP